MINQCAKQYFTNYYCKVRGSNSHKGMRLFHILTVQTGHTTHPASYTMGVGDVPEQSGRSVILATHLHLELRLRMSGPIPPLALYAFKACNTDNITFTVYYLLLSYKNQIYQPVVSATTLHATKFVAKCLVTEVHCWSKFIKEA